MISCTDKYTKLAAYQLISVHDPSEIFSKTIRPKPFPLAELPLSPTYTKLQLFPLKLCGKKEI